MTERRRRLPHSHALVLALLVLVALLRGAFWVLATPVPSPVDEANHFAYVESIATGNGIPIIGRDLVSDDLAVLLKETPEGPHRTQPVSVDPSDPGWGPYTAQYEAHQPPLYYGLQAAVLAGLGPKDTSDGLFLLRLTSLLLATLAVPVAYALARVTFPEYPGSWLAAPALLVVLEGFNANLASVTNDALLVAVAGTVPIPVALALRKGFKPRYAVWTGALLGVAMLVKLTAACAAGLVAVALVAALAHRSARPRDLVVWGALALAVAAAFVAPWLLWTELAYAGTSPARLVYEVLVVGSLPPMPLTPTALLFHFGQTTLSFWEGQVVPKPAAGPYRALLFSLLGVVGVLGVAIARRRGARARAGASVARLAAGWPLGVGILLAIVYGAANGAPTSVGRLLYAVLVPTVVALAGGAYVIAGRAGSALVAGLAAILLVLEIGVVERYLREQFTSGVTPAGEAPVIEQDRNDGWGEPAPIRVDSPCASRLFALTFEGAAAPPAVRVLRDGDAEEAPLEGTILSAGGQGQLAAYALRSPQESFSIELDPAPRIGQSRVDRAAEVGFAGRAGDPMLNVYCAVADPAAQRFERRFQYRPVDVAYGTLRAWPRWWAAVGAVVAIGVIASTAVRRLRARRR